MPGSPRFLFASPGVPGLGGASTAAYELFHRVQASGRDVHFANLIQEQQATSIRSTFGPASGNPLALANVHDCQVSAEPRESQPELRSLLAALAPDVVLAFDRRTTCLVKNVSPAERIVFVPGTCGQAQDHIVQGHATDAVTLAHELANGTMSRGRIHVEESRAVNACSLLIANSDLTLSFFGHFFAAHEGRIYPTAISFAEWIAERVQSFRHLSRPFDQRDIDVCFVATDWSRVEKNYPWVEAIAGRMRAAAVHVVGEVSRPVPGARHHGFVADREKLYELLGRARCVVSVSLIDAAPGILFEAAVMGCNVVASRNCGNWQLCNEQLLVDPFTVDGFVARIARAVERKLDDHLDAFLARRSYDDFLATLDAFARPFVPVAA